MHMPIISILSSRCTLWCSSTYGIHNTTCFGADVPSSESYCNEGVKVNLPVTSLDC